MLTRSVCGHCVQRNAVREATAFLLDALQDDKSEHAMLQTKARASDAVVCVPLRSAQWIAEDDTVHKQHIISVH